MTAAKALARTFDQTLAAFAASPAIRALAAGQVTLAHYQAILREVFHYAKEDPQLQALATVYFRGEDRATVKMFLKHAVSEIGHDLMALADLRELGVDVSDIPTQNPLPATIALTAFPFYQIHYQNPIGYLGYLYFLEFMPTQVGATYATALIASDVPRSATTFLNEHIVVDPAHIKLMDEYVQRLVRNEDDLRSVQYGMQVTGRLYGDMLWGAMQSVDHPVDYGVNPAELARRAETCGLLAE